MTSSSKIGSALKLEVMGLALVVSLAACPWATALETVPEPKVDGLAAPVRSAINDARVAVEELEDGAQADLAAAYGVLGMIYHAHELMDAAGSAYRNAEELAPYDARWSYLLGVVAAEAGDMGAAERYFRESLTDNPGYIPTRIRLARVLLANGRLDAAEALFDYVLRDAPNNAACLDGKAQVLMERQQYAEAAELLRKALEIQPAADRLNYTLGQAYRALGDNEKAQEHLAVIGTRDPLFADPVFSQMRAYSRSAEQFMSVGHEAARNGDYPAAVRYFSRAIEIDPESIMARVSLMRALEAVGQIDLAEKQLDYVIEQGKENSLIHFNKGVMHEYRSEDDQARVRYRQALAMQPDLVEARILLANSLMREGQAAEAVDHYGQLRSQYPDRLDYAFRYAMAQVMAGRCVDAVEVLHDMVARVPDDLETLNSYNRVVASCPAASGTHKQNALNASRNLYSLSTAAYITETLAMTEAAAGNTDVAAEYQSQAIFSALSAGQEAQLPAMRALLERFRQGQVAQLPFARDSAAMRPPRLTPEQRR